MLDRAAADGEPAQGVHREPVGRSARRARRTAASSPMYGGEPVNDDGTPLADGPLRRLRPRPLRAAHGGGRHDPRRRRRVAGRRLRPARPLVGTALLAGAVVVPLAHRQLRRRLRLRRLDHHVARRRAARTAAWCCATATYEHIRHATIETEWTGDDQYHQEVRATATTDDRHVRDHRAGSSTSSRCATAARRPRASSSSPASPRA